MKDEEINLLSDTYRFRTKVIIVKKLLEEDIKEKKLTTFISLHRRTNIAYRPLRRIITLLGYNEIKRLAPVMQKTTLVEKKK